MWGYGYRGPDIVNTLIDNLDEEILWLVIKLHSKGAISIDNYWDIIYNTLLPKAPLSENEATRTAYTVGFLKLFSPLRGILYNTIVEKKDDVHPSNSIISLKLLPHVLEAINKKLGLTQTK